MAQKTNIDYEKVLASLNEPNLGVASVKSLLDNAGIKTQAAADKWAQKHGSPSQPSGIERFFDALPGAAERAGKDTGPLAALPVAGPLEVGYYGYKGLTGKNAPPPAPAKKKQGKVNLPSPQQATATQPSAYDQLANALASTYLQQVNQIEPLVSGSAIPGMTQQALGSAQSANPAMAGWLAQQGAAEAQAAAPVQAARAAVGNAYAAGAVPYAGAIMNTGPANTEYLQSAPWQQILAELASETAYKAASGQGAAAFGATGTNPPPFLQQIFKNLGLAGTPGSSASGLTTPSTAAKGGTSGTTPATSGTGNPSSPSG